MSVDDYLKSLEHGDSHGEGEFTLDAQRARALLAERTLDDTWQAWLCLIQGLVRLKVRAIEISVLNLSAVFTCRFDQPKSRRELFADERFLLGWLNLEWFGEGHWDESTSKLTVTFSGSAWTRYRMAGSLKTLFAEHLGYAPISVTLNGKPLVQSKLPKTTGCVFYPSSKRSAYPLPLGHLINSIGEQARRVHWLEEDLAGEPQGLSALAFRTRTSWSQATWVSQGVVIKQERNTLERPGLWLVASVDSLALDTDLSGFKVVHNEAYFRFVNRLKKEVLWMM